MVRLYDYEDGYEDFTNQGNYEGKYWDCDLEEYVYFVDALVEFEDVKYFLFYETENYSFHTPIDEDNLSQYKNVKIIEIDQLVTSGKEVNDLISVQFANKLISVVESGNFTYIKSKKAVA